MIHRLIEFDPQSQPESLARDSDDALGSNAIGVPGSNVYVFCIANRHSAVASSRPAMMFLCPWMYSNTFDLLIFFTGDLKVISHLHNQVIGDCFQVEFSVINLPNLVGHFPSRLSITERFYLNCYSCIRNQFTDIEFSFLLVLLRNFLNKRAYGLAGTYSSKRSLRISEPRRQIMTLLAETTVPLSPVAIHTCIQKQGGIVKPGKCLSYASPF